MHLLNLTKIKTDREWHIAATIKFIASRFTYRWYIWPKKIVARRDWYKSFHNINASHKSFESNQNIAERKHWTWGTSIHIGKFSCVNLLLLVIRIAVCVFSKKNIFRHSIIYAVNFVQNVYKNNKNKWMCSTVFLSQHFHRPANHMPWKSKDEEQESQTTPLVRRSHSWPLLKVLDFGLFFPFQFHKFSLTNYAFSIQFESNTNTNTITLFHAHIPHPTHTHQTQTIFTYMIENSLIASHFGYCRFGYFRVDYKSAQSQCEILIDYLLLLFCFYFSIQWIFRFNRY